MNEKEASSNRWVNKMMNAVVSDTEAIEAHTEWQRGLAQEINDAVSRYYEAKAMSLEAENDLKKAEDELSELYETLIPF